MGGNFCCSYAKLSNEPSKKKILLILIAITYKVVTCLVEGLFMDKLMNCHPLCFQFKGSPVRSPRGRQRALVQSSILLFLSLSPFQAFLGLHAGEIPCRLQGCFLSIKRLWAVIFHCSTESFGAKLEMQDNTAFKFCKWIITELTTYCKDWMNECTLGEDLAQNNLYISLSYCYCYYKRVAGMVQNRNQWK